MKAGSSVIKKNLNRDKNSTSSRRKRKLRRWEGKDLFSPGVCDLLFVLNACGANWSTTNEGVDIIPSKRHIMEETDNEYMFHIPKDARFGAVCCCLHIKTVPRSAHFSERHLWSHDHHPK